MNPSKQWLHSTFSKYIAVFLVFTMVFVLAGCRTKGPAAPYKEPQKTVFTYYKMSDSVDSIKPIIDEFKAIPGNQMIEINYIQFNDIKKYEDRIINELAEGAGPDIFSMPNYWIAKHQKKIYPMPQNLMTIEEFRTTFVDVAEKDLIRPDAANTLQIYGLPMTVDTLALYYNKSQFEDKIPERGKPGSTWADLTKDIKQLVKADNSFERFELAGAALGRADNIAKAVEVLYAMMLQYETKFYNQSYTQSAIASQQGMTAENKPFVPGIEALNLYTSFSNSSSPYYTWNQYLADSFSGEKEIMTFAKGKASMIFGFSDYYKKITDAITSLRAKNQAAIDPNFVRITYLPQLNDPLKSTKKRSTLALYYAETVSRTSPKEKRDLAWKFLKFLTSKENLKLYNQKTQKPTSRRDMIQEQKTDQIYGIFADQAGFADSALIYDYEYYKNALNDAMQAVVVAAEKAEAALKKAEEKITSILPEKGLIPPGPYMLQQKAQTPAKTTTSVQPQ